MSLDFRNTLQANHVTTKNNKLEYYRDAKYLFICLRLLSTSAEGLQDSWSYSLFKDVK